MISGGITMMAVCNGKKPVLTGLYGAYAALQMERERTYGVLSPFFIGRTESTHCVEKLAVIKLEKGITRYMKWNQQIR